MTKQSAFPTSSVPIFSLDRVRVTVRARFTVMGRVRCRTEGWGGC